MPNMPNTPKSKTSPVPVRSTLKDNRRLPRAKQGESDIFALDIGTRNVVGIIGHMDDGVFCVDHCISIPHKRRAMLDGQIEDINETARIVKKVKEQLEEVADMTLCRVAIAAAGRALVTKRSSVEDDIEGKEKITEQMLKALELEAVAHAQDELDKENEENFTNFYCVGHTVIKYMLDDYPIKSLLGHKGKRAAVELIAAFLPGLVVESLYTVMDMSGLEVASLTLEPIAAMNVIIPPEVRLINIALVDIGAGTTDIAISQHGSIVAYAMATTAGDEITEEIIQRYLVDFETAEQMKLTPLGEDVVFTDILGFEHSVDSNEFFSSLFPAVDELADTIAKNILDANGAAPAAVFLVGGGSLIPDLPMLVSDKLQIPENRVAIGGQSYQKNVNVGTAKVVGPEFVTPIGIGITATLQTGYDFSTVTLNGNKIRLFDTKAVTIADLLMNAGYKTTQIIGKSGRGLTFNLNGEKQSVRGETSTPASISVNGRSVPLEYTVKQGDVIEFTPATIGQNASVSISDIAGEISSRKVSVDGSEFAFGTTARANGEIVTGSYNIQNYDSITIETIETLEELIMSLPFSCENLTFYKGERMLKGDYILSENDAFVTREKSGRPVRDNVPNRARDIAKRDAKANRTVDLLSSMPMTEPEAENEYIPMAANGETSDNMPRMSGAAARQINRSSVSLTGPARITATTRQSGSVPLTAPPITVTAPARESIVPSVPESTSADLAETQETTISAAEENGSYDPAQLLERQPVPSSGVISIYLNSKRTVLEATKDGSPHEFLELMALADIDISNPPESGKMILTLNGKDASFMDFLSNGDRVVIKWADK